jgi:hypothetical protein
LPGLTGLLAASRLAEFLPLMLAGPQDPLLLGRLMAETTFHGKYKWNKQSIGGYLRQFLDRCILSMGDML